MKNYFSQLNNMLFQKSFYLLRNTLKSCETKFYRCPVCLILSNTYFCTNCIKYENQKSSQLIKVAKMKEAINPIPAKPRSPYQAYQQNV